MEEEIKKILVDDELNKEEIKDNKIEEDPNKTEDLEYIFKEIEALKEERKELDEHFRES